jgi:hypothetical protein
VAKRTLIINTMPPGPTEDRMGEEGGTLRADNPDPPGQPDRYLDYETRRRLQQPARRSRRKTTDHIPEGMEGCYYLS